MCVCVEGNIYFFTLFFFSIYPTCAFGYLCVSFIYAHCSSIILASFPLSSLFFAFSIFLSSIILLFFLSLLFFDFFIFLISIIFFPKSVFSLTASFSFSIPFSYVSAGISILPISSQFFIFIFLTFIISSQFNTIPTVVR